jgi:hypothetical protein
MNENNNVSAPFPIWIVLGGWYNEGTENLCVRISEELARKALEEAQKENRAGYDVFLIEKHWVGVS